MSIVTLEVFKRLLEELLVPYMLRDLGGITAVYLTPCLRFDPVMWQQLITYIQYHDFDMYDLSMFFYDDAGLQALPCCTPNGRYSYDGDKWVKWRKEIREKWLPLPLVSPVDSQVIVSIEDGKSQTAQSLTGSDLCCLLKDTDADKYNDIILMVETSLQDPVLLVRTN